MTFYQYLIVTITVTSIKPEIQPHTGANISFPFICKK